MSQYRTEKDLLGTRNVPADALWGIYTERAIENFPLAHRPVHPALIRAFGAVKLACAITNHELGSWDAPTFGAIQAACHEMMEGMLDTHIKVDALQGGAGTSTNMNVNEVIANRALQLLGKPLGDYNTVSPLDDINLHQSTNDTYPTALKVAAIGQLRPLEREVIALLEEFQRKERATAHIVKVGRTQLQDAVLTTLGREMSAYAKPSHETDGASTSAKNDCEWSISAARPSEQDSPPRVNTSSAPSNTCGKSQGWAWRGRRT